MNWEFKLDLEAAIGCISSTYSLLFTEVVVIRLRLVFVVCFVEIRFEHLRTEHTDTDTHGCTCTCENVQEPRPQ